MRPAVDPKLRAIHDRLENDFPYFARHVLKIKDKEGKLVPLILNSAQQYLHKRLEFQLQDTGKVRALIVKGRQQGCSTCIGGRYYHRATHKEGQSVFILSHEAETTKKLFRIVERYYENSPKPTRPPAKIANKREFIFDSVNSEYGVGTAGNKDVGRGGTIQLFHGSEVGFWENTDDIQTGILQSIANLPGTEIILESTANGMGNMFYQMCMDALAKKTDYQVIFIPWYWQDEYRLDAPHDGHPDLSEEEQEYKGLYDLTDQQMYWRRSKVAELKSLWKFRQEYPAFLMEAFQTSGETLINPNRIVAARKSSITDQYAPLVLGVDPGRNRDRTVFGWRRGRQMLDPEVFKFTHHEAAQMQIAGMIAERIDKRKPVRVFMDLGHGYGVYDRLIELGYGDIVQGVHFGGVALDEEIYLNKRAEMWCLMRDWFHLEDGEVSTPDSDEMQQDFACMPDKKTTSTRKIQLESKEIIKKKFGKSPDIGDAYALTFAAPIAPTAGRRKKTTRRGTQHSGLRTLQRMRKPRTMAPTVDNPWYRSSV